MDKSVKERLVKWHDAIARVEEAERLYLELQANEKPLYAQLYLQSDGKTVKDKEALAYVSDDWRAFSLGLAVSEVAYHKEKRLLELAQASFQACYLSYKMEGEAIRKYPVIE